MVANRRYRAYFVNTLLTSDTLLFVNHNGFTYSEALQEWDWTNLIQETDYLNPATGVSATKNSTAIAYTNALTDGSGNFVSFSYTPGQDGVRGIYSLMKLPRPPATSVSGAVFLAFYFAYKVSAGLTAYTGSGQPLTNPMTTNQSLYFVNSTKIVPGIGIDGTWKPLAEFYLPPPTATDAQGTSVLGYYLLRQSGKTLWIGKLIPDSWLQKTSYPVLVDPTVFDTTTSSYVFYTPPHGHPR